MAQINTAIEPEELAILARQVGLVIPEECLPGVATNTALLRQFVDLVCSMELPDHCVPAFEYLP